MGSESGLDCALMYCVHTVVNILRDSGHTPGPGEGLSDRKAVRSPAGCSRLVSRCGCVSMCIYLLDTWDYKKAHLELMLVKQPGH